MRGHVREPNGDPVPDAILAMIPDGHPLAQRSEAGWPLLPEAYLTPLPGSKDFRAFVFGDAHGVFEGWTSGTQVWAPGHRGLRRNTVDDAIGLDPDVVLPRAQSADGVVGTPALQLVVERPLRVQIVDGDARSPVLLVQPGAGHAVPFPQPTILDVVVHTADGDRHLDRLIVDGPVRLPLP